jgi:putative transposase
MRMQLTHKIALCPTPEQVDYFKRACGTARRVWNWALNEWNKQYAVGFGVFRSQLEYKAQRYGTHLTIADRWYPNSRLCSICGWKNEALTLRDREWVCAQCGAHHDRDLNAALNLKRLATETALPVASPTSNGNGGAATERVSVAVGKVTPVRYELAVGHSGQEENRAHFCALS